MFYFDPSKFFGFAGNKTRYAIFMADLFLAAFSWTFSAYIIHEFDWKKAAYFLKDYTGLVLYFVQITMFFFWRTHNIILRYIGDKDFRIIFYSAFSTIAVFIAIWLIVFPRFGGFKTLGVAIIYSLFVGFSMSGLRIGLRYVFDYIRNPQVLGESTAIFGAGELGNSLEQILRAKSMYNYKVVVFFDDNTKVHRKSLNGIPVFNPIDSFDHIVRKYEIKNAIIAIRDLSAQRRSEFIEKCLAHDIKVFKVPPVEDWIKGSLEATQLYSVKLEDLLGRPPIVLDKQTVQQSVYGKRILVTGCAGSIGSEIVRQLLQYNPKVVIGLDSAESPLHDLFRTLPTDVAHSRFIPVLADIRNHTRINGVFEKYKPDYVFHAAAYKHVPIMEEHPGEAVNTNVYGTKILADLAMQYGVEKFVMISTDKAVNPGNVMGASKRIAEIYVQALNFYKNNSTSFITTRFGNVLGSNGSVIPIFREQIEKRQPITVTHPEIMRYFMTIPEACSLVLEAGAMGKGGEIFVFDMGEPVRILDLAHRMIQLAGLKPEVDIPIQFIGLRPGEKLYEELLDHKETLTNTHHPKIYRAIVRQSDFDEICGLVDHLLSQASRKNISNDTLVSIMKDLVPEYISQNSVFSVLDGVKLKPQP